MWRSEWKKSYYTYDESDSFSVYCFFVSQSYRVVWHGVYWSGKVEVGLCLIFGFFIWFELLFMTDSYLKVFLKYEPISLYKDLDKEKGGIKNEVLS